MPVTRALPHPDSTIPAPDLVPAPPHGRHRDLTALLGSSDLSGVRIAVLNWRDADHPRAGGAETYALQLAARLAARGAHVDYVTSAGGKARYTREHDGVHVHAAGGAVGVYPAVLAWLARHRRELDLVVDASNGIGFFSPLVLSARRTRVVYLVHHVHTDQWAQLPAPAAWLGRFLEGPVSRWVYRKARWVAVSDSTATALREDLHVSVPVAVAHNGLDDTLLARAAEATEATPSGRLVYVGRLVAHKRVDVLLEALARLAERGVRPGLDVIGDGPLRAELEAVAERLGISNQVLFHGRVDAEVRDALVASAAALAIPSHHEGWGLVVLEAAAAGIPAVGFDVPGVRDAIRHGRTGWLVGVSELPAGTEPDIVELYARALEVALAASADTAHQTRMASAARDWASRFTWDGTAEDLLTAAA